MRVSKLEIIDFRNIHKFEKNFEPGGAIFFGKNGTGKTNLLEAISYCAFGKSIRSASDSELINFSKAFFRISAKFSFNHLENIITAANDDHKKLIKIDGTKISKISELYQYVKVVYFSPEDINLISGGPTNRRKFIDLAISQSSYKYLEDLRLYHRILKQRNALLKSDFSRNEKISWDTKFIEIGTRIIISRKKYLKEFIPGLSEKYFFVSGKRENLDVEYKHSFPTSEFEEFSNSFANHLERIESDEMRLQRTLAGPHLDDIIFKIDNNIARNFGSQGQKRSLVITARLVQADIIKRKDSEAPILIFDDVLADLDRGRAQRIMDLLGEEHQIFIATPNIELYEKFNLERIDLENLLNEK